MLAPRPFRSHELLLRMQDWLTDPFPDDLSSAPALTDYTIAADQMGLLRLVGQASGHPRLGDEWITTSPIWQIHPRGTCARTSSRWYRLSAGFWESLKASTAPKATAMVKQFLSPAAAIAHLMHIRSIVERELGKHAH